jgi:hypothetical protein
LDALVGVATAVCQAVNSGKVIRFFGFIAQRFAIDTDHGHTAWVFDVPRSRHITKEQFEQAYKLATDVGELKASEPLELVIMDHTIVDNYLVLDSEVRLPLGRPTLTVAIDVYARMVLGYLVSFEPASLYSVLTTLKRVNKKKHCVQTLYPEIRRKWGGWGRPQNIVVDHAQALSLRVFARLAMVPVGKTTGVIGVGVPQRDVARRRARVVPYADRRSIERAADISSATSRRSMTSAEPSMTRRSHAAGICFKNMTFHDKPVTMYLLQQR